MHRREFITAATGTVAGTALALALPRAGSASILGTGPGPLDAKAFHAARRFAKTPFGRIAYVQRGRGPAALFIHGLPLNGFQWRGALERLSNVRRCIAPDAMGLGYSEIPASQDLSPEAQARMLAAFLDRLSIPAADLVASDSGGAIAQIFVARYPTRVRTLLLTNCDVHEDSPPPAVRTAVVASRAGRFVDDVLVPQLADKERAREPAGLGGCCYTDPAHLTDEALECYLRPIVSSPRRKQQFHDYCIGMEPNPLLPIESQLRKSQVPLRVVWGTGDTIFDPSSPDWLDHAFPCSRGVRRIPGAKLFFPEELPDVIAEEARGLWAAA